uniref:C-type lectin domain-containing protein n=1 Tax=Amphiprion percula TaxID=161767 RepID=A0A3P8T0H2_AMPPE
MCCFPDIADSWRLTGWTVSCVVSQVLSSSLKALSLVTAGRSSSTSPPSRYMSWWDAQTFCRKNHVDLSSIVTNMDRDFIIQLLLMSGASNAWIGLYRGEWAWSDGKKLIYKSLESPPQWVSDCTVMDQSTGTWRSRPCHDRLSFLCYSGEGSFLCYSGEAGRQLQDSLVFNLLFTLAQNTKM